jgi:DNA-binding transcriptional regulator GbsR (MarR family)
MQTPTLDTLGFWGIRETLGPVEGKICFDERKMPLTDIVHQAQISSFTI